MRAITKIALAVVVAAVIVAPGAAQARDAGVSGTTHASHTNVPGAAQTTQELPGYVYAYVDASFQGPYCYWQGNSGDWTGCGMINKASSLSNNGYGSYARVNFYWGKWYQGAWDCLEPGDSQSNLQNHGFAYGAGKQGYLQGSNDNIASHKWVDYCGQA